MTGNDPRLPDGIRVETGRALDDGAPVARLILSAATKDGMPIEASVVLRSRQLRTLGALALKQADRLDQIRHYGHIAE